jgi:hypothetical protein
MVLRSAWARGRGQPHAPNSTGVGGAAGGLGCALVFLLGKTSSIGLLESSGVQIGGDRACSGGCARSSSTRMLRRRVANHNSRCGG